MQKLIKIALFLTAAGLASAQSLTSQQADSFHIGNCATPCVAELALTQVPVGSVALYKNGVLLATNLYQINTPHGPSEIVVSFSASVGTIQQSDLIMAVYPSIPVNPVE